MAAKSENTRRAIFYSDRLSSMLRSPQSKKGFGGLGKMHVEIEPLGNASAVEMRPSGVILFDLDSEISAEAVRCLKELNNGKMPWPTILDEPHVIIFVLPRRQGLDAPPARDAGVVGSFEDLYDESRRPRIYDSLLLNRFPLHLSYLPGTELAGIPLTSDCVWAKDVPKHLFDALRGWADKGVASRYAEMGGAVDLKLLALLRPDDQKYVVAGAYRFGRSVVAFLPSSDLSLARWIETAVRIGKSLYTNFLCGTTRRLGARSRSSTEPDGPILVLQNETFFWFGRPVSLTPYPRRILEYLCGCPGTRVRRQDVMSAAKMNPLSTNAFKTHLTMIRQTLKKATPSKQRERRDIHIPFDNLIECPKRSGMVILNLPRHCIRIEPLPAQGSGPAS